MYHFGIRDYHFLGTRDIRIIVVTPKTAKLVDEDCKFGFDIYIDGQKEKFNEKDAQFKFERSVECMTE